MTAVRGEASATGLSTLAAYIELTKPRIIELLLVTTVPAMFLAADGWPGLWLLVATLIGGSLSAGGANAINNVFDRDIDHVMARTRGRPLPTRRVAPQPAMLFGLSLGVAGFGWLWGAVNLLAAALSTAGLVFYVVVYTMYLKRSTPQNIVIGGAAGAVPALVGWAAVTGTLEIGAWVLFAIVFVWTPPHFWALAIRYRTDYEAAGIPMLPVVIGIEDTLDHIGWYTLLLGGITLLLYPATQLGAIYLVPAVALTVALSLAAFRLKRSPDRTMVFFGWTNLFLAAISAAAIADRLATVEVGGHLAVLYLSVAIIAVAGAIVLVRELAFQRRRHVRRRLEDVLYVVAPFAGLAALVLAVL